MIQLIIFPNISRIRSKFMLLSQFLLLVVILIFPVVHLPCTVFKPAPIPEVSKLILSPLNKSCELDHIPTFLLKTCLHTLIVPITKIINLSLSSGVFSSHFKHAHVTPLLEKSSIPVNDLNSNRPISNLSFISKF